MSVTVRLAPRNVRDVVVVVCNARSLMQQCGSRLLRSLKTQVHSAQKENNINLGCHASNEAKAVISLGGAVTQARDEPRVGVRREEFVRHERHDKIVPSFVQPRVQNVLR